MKVDRHAKPPSQAHARYCELVDALGDELGRRRGWKTQVAQRLGIHPVHLNRLVKGDRPMTWEALERAAAALGIQVHYFVQESPQDWRAWRLEGLDEIPVGSVLRGEAQRILAAGADGHAVDKEEVRRLARQQLELEANRLAAQVVEASDGDGPMLDFLIALAGDK